jgi:ornithine cyclodeaminase/alanine dehydrogenase-like protein (mu-crystallin family)
MSSEQKASSAFVLNSADIRRLLTTVPLQEFIARLVEQIDAVYLDRRLRSEKRVGWPTAKLDTLEMMRSVTMGSDCVKVIGSVPSLGRGLSQVVEGELKLNQREGNRRVQLHCDATVLTPLRTAGATAAVLRRAKPDFSTLGVIGAGLEGTSHAFVLALTFPSVSTVLITDADVRQAKRSAARTVSLLKRAGAWESRQLNVLYGDATDLTGVYSSDVIVTATYGVPAYGACPVLDADAANRFRPGAFIAAVGADLVGKRELGNGIYEHARFLADDLSQCMREGELQHALAVIGSDGREKERIADHRGSLLAGRVMSCADYFVDRTAFAARTEALTVYDSTGFSGQDLAIARVVLGYLGEAGWARTVWNPPGEEDLYEMMVESGSS